MMLLSETLALPVSGGEGTCAGVGSKRPYPLNNPLPSLLLTSLCCANLAFASSASAQQVPPVAPASAPALPNPYMLVPKSNGNYLTPLLTLRPLRAAYAASPMWGNDYLQTLGTNESFVGNDAEAITDFDAETLDHAPASKEAIAQDEVLLKGYTAVDARQAILAAADHQAIFINEAHHVPMDRAFTLSLLRGLYAKGFRYFAAETLYKRDANLQRRGYPVHNTGYYTNEPVFGDLVRTAIKIGYKVVPYEYEGPRLSDPIASQNQRERGEAQNLYDRIFKNDPKAKVLVHAGYAHIAKMTFTMDFTPGAFTSQTASGDATMMALWFQRITKIVPFSVDQTNMMEHSVLQYESGYYQAAIADNLLQEVPIVLRNKAGHYFVRPDAPTAYDMIIFNPRVQYEFGRPTWLNMNGLRQAYALPGDLGVPANTSALVQAFYENEPAASAIPIDQVEIKPGLNPLPSLMLPKGRFHLRVVNGAGTVLREWHIDRNGATP